MSHLDDVLARIDAGLEEERAALLELAHRIHAHPEVRFEEVQAAAWLTEGLEAREFEVERGVGGLPTAFRARMQGRGPGRPSRCCASTTRCRAWATPAVTS